MRQHWILDGGEARDSLKAGFRVGEWLVEPTLNRVTRGDDAITLEPKVMEVLVYLAHRQGETITKDDFFETVWEGVILTDDALSRCISELRKTLEDDSRNPRYIQTIRKAGYRLIAEVRPVGPDLDDDAVVARRSPATTGAGPGDAAPKFRLWLIASVAIAVLVVLAVIVFITFGPEASSENTPTTVPYTSFPGLEIQPAFSPDGRVVAFAATDDRGRNLDIYLKQEGSETPFRLTEAAADDHNPAWSPDGQVIAFVRTDDESNAVFTIPSLGGKERMLVDFGLNKVGGLSWSPAGSELAVSAQSAPFEAFEIHLVNVDSVTVKPLTNPPRYHFGDVEPAFSPDGRHLVFVRGVTDDLQDIFLHTFGQDELRQLTSDSVRVAGVSWMPEGDAIVFSSRRRDPGGLWSVGLDGQPPRLLASSVPGRRYENPTVASDGKRLAYSDRSSNLNIWRAYKPDGFESLRSRPAIFSTYADSHPDISPDGERLVFRSNQSGQDEIWLADADGTNQSKLTAMSGSATAPRWSPDGNTIAFQGRAEGQSEVFLVDAQGGAPRRLTQSPAEDTLPQWSRDGSAVYFSSNRSGRWEIWRTSLDGGEPTQITLRGGRYGMEAPDGTELYYVKPDTLGIWKTTLDSLAEPQLVFDELDASDWANWTVRESGIYFVQRLAYAPALTFHFFDSNRKIRLVTLDNVPDHPALTAAKDFSWFAYTQIDDDGGDLMILEGFE